MTRGGQLAAGYEFAVGVDYFHFSGEPRAYSIGGRWDYDRFPGLEHMVALARLSAWAAARPRTPTGG